MQKVLAFVLIIILFVAARPLPILDADSRSEVFCTLAAKDLGAFLPASPPKEVKTSRCVLGSLEKGEADLYFPTLGTDSLERERIITAAINNKPIDEPGLGKKAFYVLNSNLDIHGRRYYVAQHYAGRFAQIFSVTFKRYRSFSASDFTADCSAIKKFFDELDGRNASC